MSRTDRNGFMTYALKCGSEKGVPVPVVDEAALLEACRIQARTWVTRHYGVQVPERFASPADLLDVLGDVFDIADRPGTQTIDREMWGMAHLCNAHAHASWAEHGRGVAHLLGVLFGLIGARAAFYGGSDDVSVMEPFGGRVAVLDEDAWMTAVVFQLATWTPGAMGFPAYDRRVVRTLGDLNVLAVDVLQHAEEQWGDCDDDDSVKALAHVAKAVAHVMLAQYDEGPGHLFAALVALVVGGSILD